MNYSELSGRALIIEAELRPTPELRAAFNAAILDGKFQGMTHGVFEAIKCEARELTVPMAFATI